MKQGGRRKGRGKKGRKRRGKKGRERKKKNEIEFFDRD